VCDDIGMLKQFGKWKEDTGLPGLDLPAADWGARMRRRLIGLKGDVDEQCCSAAGLTLNRHLAAERLHAVDQTSQS
jgi:hypothetical protein